MKKHNLMFIIIAGLILALVAGFVAGRHPKLVTQATDHIITVSPAEASPKASEFSPTKPLPTFDVYYPGTEELQPNEMRIVACGTGMPSVRPKQAAACFLVELGMATSFCSISAAVPMNGSRP